MATDGKDMRSKRKKKLEREKNLSANSAEQATDYAKLTDISMQVVLSCSSLDLANGRLWDDTRGSFLIISKKNL